MKKVLITGQHSYIGTSLERYIARYCPRWQVDTISVHGDDWRQADFGRYDAVLHVAGKAHADVGTVSEEEKREYYRVNRDLAVKVAQAAKAAGVRQFIYPGSIIIYGESAPCGAEKRITADTKPAPSNFYGDSKWQAELALRRLESDSFRVAVLRLPMVYGPDSRGNYPMLSGIAKRLPVFPAVRNKRSMLYIENLCEFIREVIEQGDSGIFYPQNAQYVSTSELVKQIAHASGKRVWLLPGTEPVIKLLGRMPGRTGQLAGKAFGNLTYDKAMSRYRGNRYQRYDLRQSVRRTEARPGNGKKALVTASVASMLDLFNRDNIRILQELGYEVHVAGNFKFGSITSQERVDAYWEELKQAGIQAYHIPIPRSIADIGNIIRSFRQMKRLCMEQKYAIVHTQSPIGGVVARLAARRLRKTGTKIIYTAHGFHFYQGAPVQNWLLFYPVEKYLSRFTDVLITINKEDYRRAKRFHAGRVCYVPGIGVDTERFARTEEKAGALRRELGLSEEDFVVVSVGQLSKRKNQKTVIRAMEQIPDPGVKYVIVGLGECEEEYKKLAEKPGLKGRVILTGYREDVEALLHMADCFVFPSLQEGLPVSLMEAMAAGVPVVCSAIRGNTDLVTDGVEGRLAEPTDAAGYARALMEIKEHPALAEKYRTQARLKIRRFDGTRVHKKMQEIYRDCRGKQ